MADGDPLQQINEQLSGIRFFNGTPLIGISCSLTIESDLTTVAGQFRAIAIDAQSGSADVTAVGRKIIGAASLLDGSAITISASARGMTSLAYLEGSATVESGSLKVSMASSSLSGEANTSFTAIRIKFGSSTQSGESDVSVSGKNIRVSQSSLSQLLTITINDFGIIRVLNMAPLSSSVTLLIADLLRFTPTSRTPGSIVSLLLLDGQPLTAQNRKYSNSNKPVYVEKKNWNATKSRYYKNQSKSGRMSFKLSWDWLPSEREDTVDKRFARNFIKDKSIDPDVHTLTVLSYGANPEDILQETQYNVFITGYDESLIRRDLQSNTYFWNCSMDLEEV
jgi:hypothetical protein